VNARVVWGAVATGGRCNLRANASQMATERGEAASGRKEAEDYRRLRRLRRLRERCGLQSSGRGWGNASAVERPAPEMSGRLVPRPAFFRLPAPINVLAWTGRNDQGPNQRNPTPFLAFSRWVRRRPSPFPPRASPGPPRPRRPRSGSRCGRLTRSPRKTCGPG
jgi:hypothetical protein